LLHHHNSVGKCLLQDIAAMGGWNLDVLQKTYLVPGTSPLTLMIMAGYAARNSAKKIQWQQVLRLKMQPSS
jgi:hypothetical protein